MCYLEDEKKEISKSSSITEIKVQENEFVKLIEVEASSFRNDETNLRTRYKVPNKETIAAIEDVENKIGLSECLETGEEVMKKLKD